MSRIRFLAYSDIHHGEYHNGLTEEDVLALEDEVLAVAKTHAVDFVVFGGDRFVSRNPLSHTRAAADAKLNKLIDEFPVFAIVGNHCRELKNAHSGHSMMHLPVLLGLRAPHIAAEAGIYLPDNIPQVEFHVIPAGQRGSWRQQGRQSNRPFCIMLFHDILKMSIMSNGQPAEHGMDKSVVDHPYYNLVLGGDNHVYQDLNLQHTTGFYVGSPCQQNWGDALQHRGYLIVNMSDNAVDVKQVISGAPKFITHVMDISEDITLPQLKLQLRNMGLAWASNIVKVTMRGTLKACSRINVGKLEQMLTELTEARRVTVITDPIIVYNATIPELTKTQPPSEDWKAYIHSGKFDIQGLDPTRIEALGLEILHEASEVAGGN